MNALNRKNSCLLLIDLQERLMAAMEKRETVIKNAEILLKGADILGLPLLATEQYPKGLGHMVDELQPFLQDTPAIEKTQFSAYTSDLAKKLQEAVCQQIIVFGSETHICVLQTVRDLISSGYEVFLVADACCSRADINHIIGLNYVEHLGATIVSTELVLFDLLKTAGTPEFKSISNLIK